MNNELSYKDFQLAKGKPVNSKEVKALLKKLKVKKIPGLQKDPDGGFEFQNYFTLPTQGVIMIFELPPKTPPQKGNQNLLFLKSIQLYDKSPKNGIKNPFRGELPGGVTFADTQKEVRKKLGKPMSSQKWLRMDRWKNISIQYL